jgi:hypothetical protein
MAHVTPVTGRNVDMVVVSQGSYEVLQGECVLVFRVHVELGHGCILNN